MVFPTELELRRVDQRQMETKMINGRLTVDLSDYNDVCVAANLADLLTLKCSPQKPQVRVPDVPYPRKRYPVPGIRV